MLSKSRDQIDKKNLVRTKDMQLKIFDNVLSEIKQCDLNHRSDREQIAIVVPSAQKTYRNSLRT